MKKFIFIIIISLIGLVGYSQEIQQSPVNISINEPIMDIGYYYGVVEDSLMNKYVFISFLTNDEDNIIHIVPYINNGNIDLDFMHRNYLESLEDHGDSIDGNVFIDSKWNIPGFDDYCYYTINNETVTFSLNIANLDKKLDVFQFKGKISDNGFTINSIVSSTDSIFNNSVLILNFQNR